MCLAVPGKILEIDSDSDELMRCGQVSFNGVVRTVNLAYVPDARPGDFVIVHVGFALAKLNEAEAGKVFELLNSLTESGPSEELSDALR